MEQIKGLEIERDQLKEAQRRQYETIKEGEKEWSKAVKEEMRLEEGVQQLKSGGGIGLHTGMSGDDRCLN